MSLKSIVATLGGDLYDGGTRANIPAPGHSRRDRSVSLLLTGGRVVVHSFTGDWREVLDDLRRQDLIDTCNAPSSITAAPAGGATAAPISSSERRATALRIWEGGRPVNGALSERHVHLRGIARSLPGLSVLRHHPEAPISVYRDTGRAKPALIAAICEADGDFSAVEITYLDPNGRRAVGLRLSRKTVGPTPPGCAIRIDPIAPELVVAEGLMTALSASERFQLPSWALMSTRNLRSWSAPEGVRSVLIAADRGIDGEASAEILAARLRRQGVRSKVALPADPHGDFNEEGCATLRRERVRPSRHAQPESGREGREGRAERQDGPRPQALELSR